LASAQRKGGAAGVAKVPARLAIGCWFKHALGYCRNQRAESNALCMERCGRLKGRRSNEGSAVCQSLLAGKTPCRSGRNWKRGSRCKILRRGACRTIKASRRCHSVRGGSMMATYPNHCAARHPVWRRESSAIVRSRASSHSSCRSLASLQGTPSSPA